MDLGPILILGPFWSLDLGPLWNYGPFLILGPFLDLGPPWYLGSIFEFLFISEFSKPKACGQTVLIDRSLLIVQKWMKNAKIEEFKYDFLS